MPEVKRGEFVIESTKPNYTFRAELGDEAPMPTSDSYGGWVVTGIPRRMGLTEWQGRPPLGLEISFIIDRLEEGDTAYVADQMDRLEKIAATYDRDREPPTCIVDSNGIIPHDYTHARWVRWIVESVTWDRQMTINSNQTRSRPLRVGGTLTLRQYNHDDTLDSYDGPAERNRKKHRGNDNKKKGARGGDRYTVRRGDTLTSIAARELGDSKRWKEIAKLNNIRNPRNLRVGQVLRMPK